MKPEKLLRILYGINLSLFCILFFLFSGYIISFKLVAIAILLSIPLGGSYILSKLIKTPFIVLLNLANSLLVFFLICITIIAAGHAVQEKKYDNQESNLDYSKDTPLYIRAIKKKAAVYLNTKYADADVKDIYSNTFPLKDSNYSLQKPDIIYDMAIYVNGTKKDNMRLIRLKFDSNLTYSVIYDRKSYDDSAQIFKKIHDTLKSLTH